VLKDVVVVALFVLAFATWVTVHVALCWRLAVRARPRWRALAALGLPPLAPIYSYREGWRRSAAVWLIAVLACALARLAAGT
jgi:hypothetical protein